VDSRHPSRARECFSSGAEAVMREVNARPGVQAWWRSHSHWFGEEFAKFINQQQQTAKPPGMSPEPMKDE